MSWTALHGFFFWTVLILLYYIHTIHFCGKHVHVFYVVNNLCQKQNQRTVFGYKHFCILEVLCRYYFIFIRKLDYNFTVNITE